MASRTLDNITGVFIAFKNFRKTLKKEISTINTNSDSNFGRINELSFHSAHLTSLFQLPNLDLTVEDVEKPQNFS